MIEDIRVFGKTLDEVYGYNGHPKYDSEAWHGYLPDEAISPLELAVSVQDTDTVGDVVFALIEMGAKATKRALEIAHLNCDHEYGIWAMHLVSNNPQLVVSEEEPPRCLLRRGYHGFDLNFCAGEIDVDTLAVCYRVCQHLVEDCNALRGKLKNPRRFLLTGKFPTGGVVPTVGVNMAADGEFNDKYPPEVVSEWLATAAVNQAEERRMAQATQLCTSCDTQTARDAFSEKEWEREKRRAALPRV